MTREEALREGEALARELGDGWAHWTWSGPSESCWHYCAVLKALPELHVEPNPAIAEERAYLASYGKRYLAYAARATEAASRLRQRLIRESERLRAAADALPGDVL